MQNVLAGSNSPRLRTLSLAIALALGTPAALAATITVNNNGDPVPSSSPGTCTLRQAFVAMNQHATGGNAGNCANSGAAFGTTDTILFASGITSIALDGAKNGELDIRSGNNLAIDGGATLGHVTISRSTGNVSVIGNRGANSFANLTLTGLTISNGAVNKLGGGVYLNPNGTSTLTLNNSVVSGNHADNGAGGVAAFGVEINNSTISGNTSNYIAGGAVGFLVTMHNSTVKNNSSYYHGGGIVAFGAEIYDSVISGNSVATDGNTGSGGGIYAYGIVSLSNTVVANNTASSYCGGIQTKKGNVYLTDSTISGNNNMAVCSFYSGGVSAFNTTFSANPGNFRAQAIYADGGVYLSNSTVSGNSGPGPAVVVSSYAPSGAKPSALRGRHGQGQAIRSLFGSHAGAGGSALAREMHHAGLQLLNTSSALTLVSSIVSQNNDAVYDIAAFDDVVAEGGYDLIGTVSNTISLASLTNEAVGNPALFALADNGCFLAAGEPTSAQCVQTMALSVTSPAYNAGTANGNTTDERGSGFARVAAGIADIGAFELQPTLPVASPASASTAANTPVGITLHATDSNPGTFDFTFAINSAPSHGTVVLGTPATTSGVPTPARAGSVQFSYSIQASNGTVTATYTPNINYSGPDSFTFTATNTDGTSAPATVNITVSAAAATPVLPAPALSRWAWLALIAQFGWIALYKLRRLDAPGLRQKPPD